MYVCTVLGDTREEEFSQAQKFSEKKCVSANQLFRAMLTSNSVKFAGIPGRAQWKCIQFIWFSLIIFYRFFEIFFVWARKYQNFSINKKENKKLNKYYSSFKNRPLSKPYPHISVTLPNICVFARKVSSNATATIVKQWGNKKINCNHITRLLLCSSLVLSAWRLLLHTRLKAIACTQGCFSEESCHAIVYYYQLRYIRANNKWTNSIVDTLRDWQMSEQRARRKRVESINTYLHAKTL